MPFIFQQPSPLSPEASIGAGRAEINAKEFGALAGLIESYGRLASSVRGGGGGGRGGGNYIGGVHQLGSTDGGALAMVEQQANRDNQASIAHMLAANDPAGRHIQMQQEYADRRQWQAQQDNLANRNAATRALVGNQQQGPVQPGPTPEPILSWGKQDENDLAKAVESARKLRKDEEAGKIRDPWLIDSIQDQVMGHINDLRSKKQAAQKQQQQQAEQEQMHAQQVLVGQRDRLDLETRKTMKMHAEDGFIKITDGDGQLVKIGQWDIKNQLFHWEDVAPKKPAAPAAKPQKEEKEPTDSHLHTQADAYAKSTVPFNADKDKYAEAITVASQKQFGELKKQQADKVEARAQKERMQAADPKAVQAYVTFTSAIPKNEAGQLDLNRASVQQLQVLEKALQDPTRLALSGEDAARKISTIRKAIEAKLNPPAAVKPIATPTPQPSIFDNPADTRALVPGGGGFDLRDLWR